MLEKDKLYRFAFVLGMFHASNGNVTNEIKVNRFRSSEILNYVKEILEDYKDVIDSNCSRTIMRTPRVEDGKIRSVPLKVVFDQTASDVNVDDENWLRKKDERFVTGFVDGYKLVDPTKNLIKTFSYEKKEPTKSFKSKNTLPYSKKDI